MSEQTKTAIGRVGVVGRYPPPLDGQSILTRRLADLLEDASSTAYGPSKVRRFNTEPTGSKVAEHAPRTVGRAVHFVRLRRQLTAGLRGFAPRHILWASISPGTAGHFRDLLCTLPAFPSSSRIHAVIHRGNFEDLFTSSLTGSTGRRMVARIDEFVFNSVGLSSRCSDWIPDEKRFVIPNTIEEDMLVSRKELDEKRRRFASRETFNVLYLSNMIPSKGFFDVAVAMTLLRDVRVRAEFAGAWVSDSDRNKLESYIGHERIADRLTVHGAINDRSRIKELIMRADVLVLPTYYPNEAQPLVLVEALNAGVPVVATTHRSIPEMIEEDRSGYFVPMKSPGDIAAAVRKLMDQETWLRLSEGARVRFETPFSPDIVRKHWLDLLS